MCIDALGVEQFLFHRGKHFGRLSGARIAILRHDANHPYTIIESNLFNQKRTIGLAEIELGLNQVLKPLGLHEHVSFLVHK
ncbi:MAG: hypothetical protein DCC65_17295 [Planctomycetota bacterium]|nr:MAG: hypothetical protein DCC65_17295 [Planctomycetota bacterium]